MKRRLTIPEAWRKIAERIDKRGLLASGLCYEVGTLFDTGVIDYDQHMEMKNAIYANLDLMINAHGEHYIDTPHEVGCRVITALFLAEEAEDELARRDANRGRAA